MGDGEGGPEDVYESEEALRRVERAEGAGGVGYCDDEGARDAECDDVAVVGGAGDLEHCCAAESG